MVYLEREGMVEFEIPEARRSQPEEETTVSGPRSLQNTQGALTAFQTTAEPRCPQALTMLTDSQAVT